MKRMVFVTHNSRDETDGVWKKICSQVNALKKIGFSVDFAYTDGDYLVFEMQDSTVIKEKIQISKYRFYSALSSLLKKKKLVYDFSYFRKPHGGFFSLSLNSVLRTLKKEKTVNFLEVPTYPYNNELKLTKDKISELFFSLVRGTALSNFHRIIYMGAEFDKIWGVDAVRISNGINVESLPLSPESISQNCVNIVGLANLEYWHGYDRVLFGMKSYSGRKNVLFHIIGPNNKECERLRKIASENKLDGMVIFHGKQTGEPLNDILLKADICIDAVGRHRSGNNINSSIKSKEFAARGLPFVKSHIDYAFPTLPFIFQVPADDSPVNIEDIIEWRESLPEGFSCSEREFAKLNLSWESQLKLAMGI